MKIYPPPRLRDGVTRAVAVMSGITVVYYCRLLPSFTTAAYYRRLVPSFTIVLLPPSFKRRLLPSVYDCQCLTVGMLKRIKRDPPKSRPWVPGSPACTRLVDKKSMYFRTCIFINIFSILAPIWAPFWNMFPDSCIIFSSIEFASIFN